MTSEQFERLVTAIEANTQAQREMAEAITDLADQAAGLIQMVAQGEEDPEEPTVDMAGKPIRTS